MSDFLQKAADAVGRVRKDIDSARKIYDDFEKTFAGQFLDALPGIRPIVAMVSIGVDGVDDLADAIDNVIQHLAQQAKSGN